MEKHTCKLCARRFSTGRALGGHMRSHMPAVASVAKLNCTSAASSSSGEVGGVYSLRENPKKSFRMVDPEFSSSVVMVNGSSSVVVQDGESETESPRAPSCHRRRSKRKRRVIPEHGSSVSDVSVDEDGAMTLIMLSLDKWSSTSTDTNTNTNTVSPPQLEIDEQIGSVPEKLDKFQCDECKRMFGSYQALGGHRASHKKVKSGGEVVVVGIAGDQKVYECPVCFRVFGSGQALGGHKRSHLCSTIAAAKTLDLSPTTILKPSLIDLNLPAPMEDEAMECSAVSDAEFVMSNYQTNPIT